MATQAYLKNPSVLVEVGDDGTRRIIAIGGVPVDIGGGGGGESVIVSTYEEVKTLRDNGELIPGCWYRITDYDFTCCYENIISAHHAFDILVLATSNNSLSEEARAIKHEGDTYFANNKLNAWKLWYCIDNDSNRFHWADNEGKGVIYRMIDEFNNDVCYDFKNLFYDDYEDDTTTFNGYTFGYMQRSSDHSLGDYCRDNFIGNPGGNTLYLPFVILHVYNNTYIRNNIVDCSQSICFCGKGIEKIKIYDSSILIFFDTAIYIRTTNIYGVYEVNLKSELGSTLGEVAYYDIAVDSDDTLRCWCPADPAGT